MKIYKITENSQNPPGLSPAASQEFTRHYKAMKKLRPDWLATSYFLDMIKVLTNELNNKETFANTDVTTWMKNNGHPSEEINPCRHRAKKLIELFLSEGLITPYGESVSAVTNKFTRGGFGIVNKDGLISRLAVLELEAANKIKEEKELHDKTLDELI